MPHQPIKNGIVLWVCLGRIAGDKSPQNFLVMGMTDPGQIEKDVKAQMRLFPGRSSVMDMPGGVFETGGIVLFLELAKKRQIFINIFRNNFEIEPLRPARLMIPEQR